MKLLQNHSIKNYNTFGVDVKAKYFAEVFNEDELIGILSDKKFKPEKKFVLGGGSNVLFTKDFNGIIIKLSNSRIKPVEENSDSVVIEADAGVIWDVLVDYAVEKNYGGIENLKLIPGTVGAAPVQNIGAYGQELTDTFESLNGVYINSADTKIFNHKDCRFSYRSSIFKQELKNQFIITSVKLKLKKNPKANTSYNTLRDYLNKNQINTPTIRDACKAVASIRSKRLPDTSKIGNAGSFFKNPIVGKEIFLNLETEFPDIISFPSDSERVKISAGWLIEKCGWKGKRIGDVGTSSDHALIICNFGKASGAEIFEFAVKIKEAVLNKFGIKLEEEVNII